MHSIHDLGRLVTHDCAIKLSMKKKSYPSTNPELTTKKLFEFDTFFTSKKNLFFYDAAIKYLSSFVTQQ